MASRCMKYVNNSLSIEHLNLLLKEKYLIISLLIAVQFQPHKKEIFMFISLILLPIGNKLMN